MKVQATVEPTALVLIPIGIITALVAIIFALIL